MPVDVVVLAHKVLDLIEHDFHRCATEDIATPEDIAPAEEVRDPVCLLKLSPFSMCAIEPHIFMQELRTLGHGDHRIAPAFSIFWLTVGFSPIVLHACFNAGAWATASLMICIY